MKLYEILFNKPSASSKQFESPEASEDAPFGKYLFGKDRNEIHGENVEPEENTKEETKFFNALSAYYVSNVKSGLNSFVDMMVDISKNTHWYRRFFHVKKPKAWRLILGLSEEQVKNITGLNDDLGKLGVVLGGNLSDKSGSNFSSWTANKHSLVRLLNQIRNQGDVSLSGYAILAEASTSSNNFFFNMFEVANYLAVGDLYQYQQEILASGNVNLEKVSYVKITSPNPKKVVETLLDLLDQSETKTFQSYSDYIQKD